jgi:hypothetical protein
MKQHVSNWTLALLVVGLVGIIPPVWGEMYEWCDPETGVLRLGDRPPSGVVQFWLDGARPAPVLRDGKPQPLCTPTPPASAASPASPAPQSYSPSETPAKAVSQSAEVEVQKRNAAVIENLVRQTPHYQDGSLAGSDADESASGNRGIRVR